MMALGGVDTGNMNPHDAPKATAIEIAMIKSGELPRTWASTIGTKIEAEAVFELNSESNMAKIIVARIKPMPELKIPKKIRLLI